MTALDPARHPVGVVGAGAMGAGIAQVAAAAGHPVLLFDSVPGRAVAAIAGIASALNDRVGKGRMTAGQRQEVLDRLRVADGLSAVSGAALVLEAVVEDLAAKRDLLRAIEELVSPEAILATNTSSLSVTGLARTLRHPGRMAGMHFFNPAPAMPLVEVVCGPATLPEVARTLADTARAWGKTPVSCRSTPGFIVNRVARPFYAEAMRLLLEGAGDPATLDAVYRDCGGFRMGPLELADMIGHDVNFAVTRSVHAASFFDPRFQPSLLQQELVEAGWLGRKSGRGFYDYSPQAPRPVAMAAPPAPAPASMIAGPLPAPALGLLERAERRGLAVIRDTSPGVIRLPGATLALTDGRSATCRAADDRVGDLVLFDLVRDWAGAGRVAITGADQAGTSALAAAAGLFQALGMTVTVLDDIPGLAVMRTVAMLANEAAETLSHRVASAGDIDLAMTLGVAYPDGPLAWADRIGLPLILGVPPPPPRPSPAARHRPAALLRRRGAAGGRLHD
ncbi:MAG: 3-hydroxyacyl-CoA dehydrogenase [Telmatospirillum sp.]|nr:3-hydroxyacyl-CoA dehydrogenase [Telmatospirillum sp.]